MTNRSNTPDKAAALGIAKVEGKIDREITKKRLTVQQGLTLAMVYRLIQANPDGPFAEDLVKLIQGEYV